MSAKKSLTSIIAALKSEEKRLSNQYASVQKRLQQIDSDSKRIRSALAVLQDKRRQDHPSTISADRQDASVSTEVSSPIVDVELKTMIENLLSSLSEAKSELKERVQKAVQDLTRFEEPSERSWTLRTFRGEQERRA